MNVNFFPLKRGATFLIFLLCCNILANNQEGSNPLDSISNTDIQNDTTRCLPCLAPSGPCFPALFNSALIGQLCVSGPGGLRISTGPLSVCGSGTFGGPVIITDPTQSFACNEGALTVVGGVGIMGNLNVCGSITATGGISTTGPLIFTDPTASTNCTNGALVVPFGGVGIGGDLNVCGTITALGGFSGPGASAADYLFAYDTTPNQSASTTFANAVFGSIGAQDGWINNFNSFTCPVTGLYLIQYMGEFATTLNLISVAMKAVVNGVDVPGSYSTAIVNVTSSTSVVPLNHSFLTPITAGQVLQIQFVCDFGSNASLTSVGGPGVATVKPCVTLTITRIE